MSAPVPASSSPTAQPLTGGAVDGLASGTASGATIDALLAVLRPLAQLAIDQGVQFGQMEELLKRAMVEAAVQATRDASGSAAPVSRLSVVAGIHRKEVKRLLELSDPHLLAAEATPAAVLFTRWVSDPAWRDGHGRPGPLPRRAAEPSTPSFEQLARSVTTDVHPRTLLDELLRLELAVHDLENDSIRLRSDSFVPAAHLQSMLGFLGANVGDHLAAARANVATSLRAAQQPEGERVRPPFVEQALFADRLSEASVATTLERVRRHWSELLDAFAPELERLEAADRASTSPADRRVRIGLYCYAEPMLRPARSADPDSR
jgi:hypothetical protein